MNHAPSGPPGKNRYFVLALLATWLAYAALTLLSPGHQAGSRYGLTPVQINLLRLTILLPYLFIWATALFAGLRFRNYASLLENSAETPAFKKIVSGFWLLLLVLIVPPFLALISTFSPESDSAQKIVTIVSNYVTAGFYLAAFWQLQQAAKNLNQTLPNGDKPSPSSRLLTLGVSVALAFAYAWLVFHNPYRTASTDSLVRPTYFLPDWLIVTTIMLPYLGTWYLGLRTIQGMLRYSKNVTGVIYRQAFRSVAYGLTMLVSLLIGLQFLTQMGAYLGHAAVRAILIIIYLILLALVFAYLFIARGARKLTAIEKA